MHRHLEFLWAKPPFFRPKWAQNSYFQAKNNQKHPKSIDKFLEIEQHEIW